MTIEEVVKNMKERERRADREYAAKLLTDIPRYHRWYAETKNPHFLEGARVFGEILSDLYKKWENPPVKEI